MNQILNAVIEVLLGMIGGFSLGALLVEKFRVEPLVASQKKLSDMFLDHLDKDLSVLNSLKDTLGMIGEVEADGSVKSPIQLKKD